MLAWLRRLGLGLNLPTILLATALPLIVAVLYVGITELAGMPALRYNPSYFSDEYVARYDVPGAVVIDLERALRTGDRHLMAELQGLRRPVVFPTSPNVRMTILYEATDRYFSYLFWDTRTYDRFPYHVEQVNGRWVVAPEDAYYYLHSGRWVRTWLPLAEIWWIVEVVTLAATAAYHLMLRWRRETLAY